MKRLSFLLGALCVCAITGCITSEKTTERVEVAAEDATDSLSNWRFYPAFTRLGRAVTSSPAQVMGESTEIVLSTRSEISLVTGLVDRATGKSPAGGAVAHREGTDWRIRISFPENGSYELFLLARTASEKDYTLAVTVEFEAKLSLDVSGILVSAVRFQDPDRMKLALERGADPAQDTAYIYIATTSRFTRRSAPCWTWKGSTTTEPVRSPPVFPFSSSTTPIPMPGDRGDTPPCSGCLSATGTARHR